MTEEQKALDRAAENAHTTMLHVYTEVLDWLQWAEHADEDKAEKTLAFIRFQRELLASRDAEVRALREKLEKAEETQRIAVEQERLNVLLDIHKAFEDKAWYPLYSPAYHNHSASVDIAREKRKAEAVANEEGRDG